METAQGPARATALHQRAWLLRLAALEMHVADAALPAHREALEELLTVLLLPHDAGALQMHTLDTQIPGYWTALRGQLPCVLQWPRCPQGLSSGMLMCGGIAGTDGERRDGCMAGLLEAAAYPISQPQLGHEAGPELSRLQQVPLTASVKVDRDAGVSASGC